MLEYFLRESPFTPYGPSHWAVLGLFALCAAALTRAGRRLRGTSVEARAGRLFAGLILAVEVPLQLYSMTPRHWDVGLSLPLHICDLAWMLSAWALWTRSQRAYALVFYWGLTLTSQALVTPHLEFEFPHLGFIMFWAGHCLVVLGAIYMTEGLGMRPSWKDYRAACALTAAWSAAVFAFNLAAGTNYMYLNAKPPTASILDLFGPWPIYLAAEAAVLVILWAAMTAMWDRPRKA